MKKSMIASLVQGALRKVPEVITAGELRASGRAVAASSGHTVFTTLAGASIDDILHRFAIGNSDVQIVFAGEDLSRLACYRVADATAILENVNVRVARPGTPPVRSVSNNG